MLAVVTVAAWLLLLPMDVKDTYQSVAAAIGMTSSVLFWKESGYFAGATELTLLHTWSLAVEEQFYLLWPLGMLALCGQAGAGSRRW